MGILKEVDFFMKDKDFRCDILEDLFKYHCCLGIREINEKFIDNWVKDEYNASYNEYTNKGIFLQYEYSCTPPKGKDEEYFYTYIINMNNIKVKALCRIIDAFEKEYQSIKREQLKESILKLEVWKEDIWRESKRVTESMQYLKEKRNSYDSTRY